MESAFNGGDIHSAVTGNFTGTVSGEGPMKSLGLQQYAKEVDPFINKNANGKDEAESVTTQKNADAATEFRAANQYAKPGQYSGYDWDTQQYYADGGGIMALARGGSLGEYSDGGQMLRGPGDGVSDSIPANINGKQPARLADGEFVVPARIVSELGNGSSEAGARQLYAMLDRIQNQRKKTVGKGKVAVNSRAAKHLPA
jgi:hypothetical protein